MHELKELEKNLKDVRRTTVWPLLAGLMAVDTGEHIMILEFLRTTPKRPPARVQRRAACSARTPATHRLRAAHRCLARSAPRASSR